MTHELVVSQTKCDIELELEVSHNGGVEGNCTILKLHNAENVTHELEFECWVTNNCDIELELEVSHNLPRIIDKELREFLLPLQL